jgi:hypothetical protein
LLSLHIFHVIGYKHRNTENSMQDFPDLLAYYSHRWKFFYYI